MKKQPPRWLTLWSWAIYDLANTGFAVVVMTALFPVFFGEFWAGSMAEGESTFWFGFAASAAGAVTVFAAPFLGALADLRAMRKKLLLAFTGLGVIATAGLFFVGAGQWETAVIVFIVAVFAFSSTNLCYDSLLRGLTRLENRHSVSAAGFALGYFGSTLLLVGSLWLVRSPEHFGLADSTAATRVVFLVTASWWLVFTAPLALFVSEPPALDKRRRGPLFRQALSELWHSLQIAWRQVELRWFLLAFFFYSEGINAVSKMALKLGSDLGFERDELLMALVVAQLAGVPFTLLFGFLGQRFSVRYSLFAGIFIYLFVIVYASRMSGEPIMLAGRPVPPIYLLGGLIGVAHGGMLALSRSFFANLIPPEREGTFFGLYNVIGKASNIFGPVFVGGVALLADSTQAGILVLGVFFIVGFAFLLPATRRSPKVRKGEASG